MLQAGVLVLQVTLVVPWLAKCDQELTFIDGLIFETPDQQEKFMGEWITKRTNLAPKYKVVWYSGMSTRICTYVTHHLTLNDGNVLLLSLRVTGRAEAHVTLIRGTHPSQSP